MSAAHKKLVVGLLRVARSALNLNLINQKRCVKSSKIVPHCDVAVQIAFGLVNMQSSLIK